MKPLQEMKPFRDVLLPWQPLPLAQLLLGKAFPL